VDCGVARPSEALINRALTAGGAVRDLVNVRRRHRKLMKEPSRYNTIRSAMDVLSDTTQALAAYATLAPQAPNATPIWWSTACCRPCIFSRRGLLAAEAPWDCSDCGVQLAGSMGGNCSGDRRRPLGSQQ